jgi:tetratricopeptide (TPR) repeat protein
VRQRGKIKRRDCGNGVSIALLLTLFVVSTLPLLPMSLPLGIAAESDDDDDDGTKRKKKSKSKSKKKRKPEPSNLKFPEDLTKDQEAALRKGIDSFQEAMNSRRGADADHVETAKRMRRAYKQLQRATEKAPKCAVAQYYFGVLLYHQKKHKKAAKALNRAIKVNPQFFEAWVALGDVQRDSRNWEASLGHYDRALQIYPDYGYGMDRKGDALIALGKLKSAKKYLRRAQKLRKHPRRKVVLQMLDREIDGPAWKKTFIGESKIYRLSTPISQSYADKMAAQLDIIHRLFEAVFKNVEAPDRKFDVWVFEDRQTFIRGGGHPMAAGQYSFLLRKIDLFRQKSASETIETLNHEGFHQFIDDYAPNIPQWLNEGFAEYFAPFELKGKMMMSRPNKTRLRYVKRDIKFKLCTPASELMVMTIGEMYDPHKIHTHYNQAWGMIHYMFESDRKKQYGKVLKSYVSLVGKGADLDEAYEKTFGKIDMDKFEDRWKSYILTLDDR